MLWGTGAEMRGHMRRILLYSLSAVAAALVAVIIMRQTLPRLAARSQPAPTPTAARAGEPIPAGSVGPARMVSLEVGGMVCAACSIKVTRALSAVPGMRRVALDLKGATVQLECDSTVADTALTAAVRRAGPEYLGLIVSRP